MSAMQKEALWDMSYQMGSLMDHTGLKASLVAGSNEKILWEIMKNSEYGKQTPGRARENAEMLFSLNQNNNGSLLEANKGAGAGGGPNVYINQGGNQVSNGDSNYLASSKGSAHGNNPIAGKVNSGTG